MPFFTYDQNNSGGNFIVDENVSHYVIIEAKTASQANKLAESIGIYFDGVRSGIDCECCGDRWYEFFSDREGDSEPMIYGTPAKEYVPSYSYGADVFCIIHYLNGDVEKISEVK